MTVQFSAGKPAIDGKSFIYRFHDPVYKRRLLDKYGDLRHVSCLRCAWHDQSGLHGGYPMLEDHQCRAYTFTHGGEERPVPLLISDVLGDPCCMFTESDPMRYSDG